MRTVAVRIRTTRNQRKYIVMSQTTLPMRL